MLTDKILIGIGRISQTYSATYDGMPVIIKSITHGTKKTNFERDCNIPNMLDHPNIIKILHVNDYDIVYPYMANSMALHKYSKKNPNIAINHLIYQLCDAIKYMHSVYIVHRDIKPENIITDGTNIKLIDFDLAANLMDDQYRIQPGIVGTPIFIDPVIWLGECKSYYLADIYAIGITMYWLSDHQYPYKFRTVEELEYKLYNDKPRELNKSKFSRLIMSIINKNPELRPSLDAIMEQIND